MSHYDGGERRPPRSARPQHAQATNYDQQSRPQFLPSEGSRGNVSFQNTESGQRHEQIDQQRQRTFPSAYQPQYGADVEAQDGDGRVSRKKSLVRPDREKIEPGHRQWHYRSHVDDAAVGVQPSSKLPLLCDGDDIVALTPYLQQLATFLKAVCAGASHFSAATRMYTNLACRCSSEARRSDESGQQAPPRLRARVVFSMENQRNSRVEVEDALEISRLVRRDRGWCTATC